MGGQEDTFVAHRQQLSRLDGGTGTAQSANRPAHAHNAAPPPDSNSSPVRVHLSSVMAFTLPRTCVCGMWVGVWGWD
jgi:hypothetical protein